MFRSWGTRESSVLPSFNRSLRHIPSYVVGATVPRGTVPLALFWDTCDPYHYLRVDEHARTITSFSVAKTIRPARRTDPAERFLRLEELLSRRCPKRSVKHRWSGQVIETNDGLPFIGETAERQFVATGYAGNGMTFGTDRGGDGDATRRSGAEESVASAFRRQSKETSWRNVGLHQGESRLSRII